MKFADICDFLEGAGIPDARIEAEILVDELFGDAYVSEDRDYAEAVIMPAIEKRCLGYPLQYIIGKWWFARCVFKVDENCLIPRPDTETVVEEAARMLAKNAKFADLCTGSGCIAIALLDLRPDLCGRAVELYSKTLEIAEKNARLNRVDDRLRFTRGDVLLGEALGDERFDAIISNPPYIRTNVIDTLSPEVKHEPRVALDGGEDGLIFYRAIVQKYKKNLCDGGIIIFEIGYDQADDLRAIAYENGFECEIVKDLSGCDRVAILR